MRQLIKSAAARLVDAAVWAMVLAAPLLLGAAGYFACGGR